MNQFTDMDRPRSAPEVAAASMRSREAVRDASYYHRRANQHQAMGDCADPAAVPVHRELAAAYRAAATAAERGEIVDFSGWHRGERHDPPAPAPPSRWLRAAE